MMPSSFGFYFISAFASCCVFAFGIILPKESLKDLFAKHSGLDSKKISDANFYDLKLDIGTTKDAKIIRSIRGGMGVVRWGDTDDSFVSIRIFSQRLYDDYSQEMDVPIHIIKGTSSENSLAALDNGKLVDAWKVGTLENIGAYCVGELRGGLAGNLAPTGYFLDDEYGFCLQINTLKSSGIKPENIEEIGKTMIAEVKALAKSENIIPNPLNKGGTLAVSESRVPKRKIDAPSKINDASGILQKQHNDEPSGNNMGTTAILALAILVLLVGILRIWKRKH